jgi:AraC-like DNA-binding protein
MGYIYQWDIHKQKIRVGKSRNPGYSEHFHNYLEFIYLLEGSYSIKIDGVLYEMSKGDFVILFPYQLHELISTTGDNYELVCVASPDTFSEYDDIIKNFVCASSVIKSQFLTEECKFLLDWIANTRSNMRDVFRLRKMLLCLIFREITLSCDMIPRSELNMTSIQRILKYCNDNYLSDNISLDNISKSLGINRHHISHLISDNLNVNFSTYINELRINHACELIDTTDMSVTNISMECGFGSIRNFNRTFMKLKGTTPSEYKSRKSNNSR